MILILLIVGGALDLKLSGRNKRLMEALDRNVFVVGEDANVVSIKDASSVKEPRNDSVIQRKSFTGAWLFVYLY